MASTNETSCQSCAVGETSALGSASASDCVPTSPLLYNLYATTENSNGLLTFSEQGVNFETVATSSTGANLAKPKSLVFVSSTTLLISNSGSDRVFEYTYAGEFVRVFAAVADPRGLDAALNATLLKTENEVRKCVHVATEQTSTYDVCGYQVKLDWQAVGYIQQDYTMVFNDLDTGDPLFEFTRLGSADGPQIFDFCLPCGAPTVVSPVEFTASFRDRFGLPLPGAVDISGFVIKAMSGSSSVDGTVTLRTDGNATFSVDIKTAGVWTIHLVDVFNDEYEEHMGGSPYTVTVSEGPTDPASCVLDYTSVMTAGDELRVAVNTSDAHDNPTVHSTDAFRFSLDGTVLNGEDIKDSPVSVDVAPDWTLVLILTTSASLFTIALAAFVLHRRAATTARAMLEDRVAGMDASQKKLQQVHMNLAAEKEELEEEIRLKKHSEEDLRVMVAALEAVSKERQDELKEVMIDSSELKIDRLLGKGGFGVVNLATYRGTNVAMKQLLTVNEENVLRFRHECFLMKNLSHPNVVKLTGVCWSEELFACLLEFVENGSLEDWLRRTTGGKTYVPPVKIVVGKKKTKKSFNETVHLGFNPHNDDYSALIPSEDLQHAKETKAYIEELEKEGSGGAVSVCYRLSNINPRFTGLASGMNKIVAKAAAKLAVPPMLITKENVELALKEYALKPLPEVAFKGFNLAGEYDEKEHTETDRLKGQEAKKLAHEWWMERMNPKKGWKAVLEENGERLDAGVEAVQRYNNDEHRGEAIAHCFVNARPSQVFGAYSDSRFTRPNERVEVLDSTYTASTELLTVPVNVPTVSDRESLYRSVNFVDVAEQTYWKVGYTVEDERRPPDSRTVRMDGLYLFIVKEMPRTEGNRSECWQMNQIDFKFGTGLGFANAVAAEKASEHVAEPLVHMVGQVEKLLNQYKPPVIERDQERVDLTWKGRLWRMALEAALGVQYLHHHRYWSDGGQRHNGAINAVEEEEAGWKESVIHRDLKPDNMLLTNDWKLKLTDFGEARAQNMGGTMTSVGTPIYIAPEVMRGDHYDEKADTWSYGLCLVAMIRAERTLEQLFYQALKKHKRKRNTKGLGMGQMTKYYYQEGWRPILPLAFVKSYPKLHELIQECWRVRRKERPTFDQIVTRLQGDIGDEIKRKEEPRIVVYSLEPDQVYWERVGKEDEIEESEEEEEGGGGTGRGSSKRGVSRRDFDKVRVDFDRVMDELGSVKKREEELLAKLEEKEKEVRELKKKGGEGGGKGGEGGAKRGTQNQLGAMMAGWGN
ncbi:hypothetical protein TeGR_g5775 [Tetraparma gracilis]|uniref:Protein kinase domain-containing protein n=1 Tax=Tetraparma gracilis TaxID=2962635 RepID=A0ABQ6N208_9STRA|nr:hypothetical protein TeGR_g5775 [Tetraparma gracilis]